MALTCLCWSFQPLICWRERIKTAPSGRGDTVPLNEEVGDVAPAVHGSGQETQEGEVLRAPDARAAWPSTQHQGVLGWLAQHVELKLDDAALVGGQQTPPQDSRGTKLLEAVQRFDRRFIVDNHIPEEVGPEQLISSKAARRARQMRNEGKPSSPLAPRFREPRRLPSFPVQFASLARNPLLSATVAI